MNRIGKRALVAIAIIIVVVAALSTAGAYAAYQNAHKKVGELQAQAASDFSRMRERVLADQRALASDPLFAPRTGTRDASALLATRAGWKGAAAKPAHTGVPDAVVEQVRAFKDDWTAHVDDVDLTGVDLAWMKELAGFDAWDLETPGGPFDQKPWSFMTLPMPDLAALSTAAKVRLLLGLKSNDAVSAGAEVHELARLCISTETLIGEMIAVSMLKLEDAARTAAEHRGVDVSAWRAYSSADTDRIKRALWTEPAFFSLITPDAGVDGEIVVGRCAAVQEGLASALLARGLLRDRYATRYAQLDQALASSPQCRLRNLRRVWAAHDHEGELPVDGSLFCSASLAPPDAPACRVPDAALALPFVRAALGETLLSIALPDWFKLYRDAP